MSTTAPPDGPPPAPDDGIPPDLAGLPDLYDDEGAFGGEAAVPEDGGGYTGSLRSRMPQTDVETGQIRELERRLRERMSPAFPLDKVRRIPGEFLWRRYRDLMMRRRSTVVDPYGRDPKLTARLEPLLDLLYQRYFRVEASGAEHLPRSGPAILVANHSGPMPYDSLVLMQAVRRETPAGRQVRPLLEDAVFHFPYLGVLLNRIGAVRACPENAERLLTEGNLIAVFPEGEQGTVKLFRDRHKLQRFGRGGFVKLALRTGVPLIPVAMVGAEEAAPTLARISLFGRSVGLPYLPITPTFPLLGPAGLLPLPAKWRVRFGEPIELTRTHGAEAADDRLLVSRLTDQIRTGLQEMLMDLSSGRG